MRSPVDSFERYCALGQGRSYARLSAVIGISKRSIVSKAKKERWQERLRAIEEKASMAAISRLNDDFSSILERHLRAARIVQAKAIEAMKGLAVSNAEMAAKTLIAAQREEREIIKAANGSAPTVVNSIPSRVR